jgi:DNA invertase Pin-like site-specific DNA recombinase
MVYGYGRVSSDKQETTLQLDAFKAAGVCEVVTEKWKSRGVRPRLQALLDTVGPGDVFVVWKLDRAGRSLYDLLSILTRLQNAGCSFRSMTEGIDTETLVGRLMFQMVGAFAEYEWGLIRERSTAGQRSAMARGVHCGRPRSLASDVEADIVRLYRSRWYTLRSLAQVFDCHPSTVKRAVYRVHKPGHSSLR